MPRAKRWSTGTRCSWLATQRTPPPGSGLTFPVPTRTACSDSDSLATVPPDTEGSNVHTSALAAIGRLLIAVLFLLSGLGKIAAPAMTQAYIASAGLPAPMVAYAAAIIIEVGGGLLLLIGYQTRAVALLVA